MVIQWLVANYFALSVNPKQVLQSIAPFENTGHLPIIRDGPRKEGCFRYQVDRRLILTELLFEATESPYRERASDESM